MSSHPHVLMSLVLDRSVSAQPLLLPIMSIRLVLGKHLLSSVLSQHHLMSALLCSGLPTAPSPSQSLPYLSSWFIEFCHVFSPGDICLHDSPCFFSWASIVIAQLVFLFWSILVYQLLVTALSLMICLSLFLNPVHSSPQNKSSQFICPFVLISTTLSFHKPQWCYPTRFGSLSLVLFLPFWFHRIFF